MPDSDPTVDLTPSAAARAFLLNELCARFEAAWKAAGPLDPEPQIEDFLAEADDPERADLLRRLVVLDVEHRRRRGGRPTPAEYEARFPDWSGRLFPGAIHPAEAEEQPADSALNLHSPESAEAPGEIDGVETAVQPPSFRPQLRSERYVVGEFHARGGVGEIWMAEDAEIGRTVALKRLRPNREAQKDRFLVEAQVTGQLEHPGIVPVHDLGVDEAGRPFYVMSFIHGRTLKDVLAEYHEGGAPGGESREVRLVRLLEIFVQICQTVAYAHHRGVLHRDLKPENVMLGPFGEVLVLDWGMAKLHGQPGPETAVGEGSRPVQLTGSSGSTETEAGTVLGSPPYMPPEAAEGRTADFDERTDVYLLGATLYHLLTGKPPREGSSVHEIIELARTVAPPPPRRLGADVPKALEAICLKAMAQRKDSRYKCVRDLIQDMEHYLAGAPVSAYPEPMVVRIYRWCKRHRRALVRALSAALLLTLFATGTTLLIKAWNHAERIKREADLLRRREPASAELAAFHHLAEERQFLASVTTPALQAAVDYDAQHGREAGEKAVAIADRLDRELEELAMTDERKALHAELHDLLVLTAAQAGLRPGEDRDQTTKILASLERAISLPGHGPSRAYYRLKARCHQSLGEEKEAALADQRALAEPPTALDHFLQAEEFRARASEPAQTSGDAPAWQPNRDLLLKAVAEYQEALRLEPNHFWCFLQMGRSYLSLKQGAEAVAALDACVALRPNKPWGYSARGLAKALLRDDERAEADLARALEIDREFVPARLHRGIMAWLQGKDDRALADFASVLDSPSERRLVEAAYYRAQLHIRRNEISEALTYLDMVVKESPSFRPAYLSRAQAHFRDGGKARGLADLTTFLNLGRSKPFGPNDPVLLAQRGGLLLRLAPNWGLSAGEHAAALVLARDDLERALRMGHRTAQVFDDLGSLAHKLGDRNTELGAYEQVLSAEPSNELAVKVHTKRGWINCEYGDLPHRERARADFAAAVRLDRSHADAHAGLGFLAALERSSGEAKGEAALALWHGANEYLLLHNVACIYAELSRVETGQGQAQQNGDIAMALLGRAVALCRQVGDGNFEIECIKGDRSLSVLSGRQDFRELIVGANGRAEKGQ
jgi:serine/threonine protein kinase/tetratricopeptide (TPR) repeat protein